jgi:hypothetical protein
MISPAVRAVRCRLIGSVLALLCGGLAWPEDAEIAAIPSRVGNGYTKPAAK